MRTPFTAATHVPRVRTITVLSVVASVAVVIALTFGTLFGQYAAVKGEVFTGGATTENDPGTVVAHNLSTRTKREIYRPQSGRVFDFKVSPSAELIGVIQQILQVDGVQEGGILLPNGKRVSETSTLKIVNARGAEVDAIPLVRSLGWSSDGEHLAYIVGTYQGPEKDYVNRSAWIWDAGARSRRKIYDGGYYVSWPAFDGNIYLWEQTRGIANEVVRYNIGTNTIEKTRHLSIYFSPTGQYYYHPGGGIGLPENVYLRSSDTSVRETSKVLAGLFAWRPIGWAPNSDLLLMRASRRSGDGTVEDVTIVYDPNNDTSTDVSPDVIGWGDSSTFLVTQTGDVLRAVTLMTAPLRH